MLIILIMLENIKTEMNKIISKHAYLNYCHHWKWQFKSAYNFKVFHKCILVDMLTASFARWMKKW